jgi:hypothetical protein
MWKLLHRRRRHTAFGNWQVWAKGGDGRWSRIGAPRETLQEAAQLARMLSYGRVVAVLPAFSRPIDSV